MAYNVTMLDIKQMSDSHIFNRINWLKRKKEEELDAMHNAVAFADPDGDMGFSLHNNEQYYEDEINFVFDREIKKLEKEQKLRNDKTN